VILLKNPFVESLVVLVISIELQLMSLFL